MNAGGTKVISEPVLVFDGNDGVNHTIEAVSYTHLDVYKRQAIYMQHGVWYYSATGPVRVKIGKETKELNEGYNQKL